MRSYKAKFRNIFTVNGDIDKIALSGTNIFNTALDTLGFKKILNEIVTGNLECFCIVCVNNYLLSNSADNKIVISAAAFTLQIIHSLLRLRTVSSTDKNLVSTGSVGRINNGFTGNTDFAFCLLENETCKFYFIKLVSLRANNIINSSTVSIKKIDINFRNDNTTICTYFAVIFLLFT